MKYFFRFSELGAHQGFNYQEQVRMGCCILMGAHNHGFVWNLLGKEEKEEEYSCKQWKQLSWTLCCYRRINFVELIAMSGWIRRESLVWFFVWVLFEQTNQIYITVLYSVDIVLSWGYSSFSCFVRGPFKRTILQDFLSINMN